MAIEARLAAQRIVIQREWPWHNAKWGVVPAHVLWWGDRRMEGETYLSSGYGLRIAIQGRAVGWMPFGQLARVTMPNRTKATLVSPDYGTPFLTATQVFDVRPFPRKWLAPEKISDAQALLTRRGLVLVTRSGNVGRATLATSAHDGALVSDDLLRVEARKPGMCGWLYSYLRSPQARAMMIGAHYGHIIKHLETTHLDALPVPVVRNHVAGRFRTRTQQLLALREEAQKLWLEAEALFEKALGTVEVKDWGETGFEVRASALRRVGRRLDAARHNPGASAIWKHLADNGKGFVRICDAGFNVWVPGRYKRIPAAAGVAYWDSADLLEVCPDVTKRFADCRFGDDFRGRVQSGWLLMPCSGQVYGIIGSVVMAGPSLEGQVVSNHVIRIAPRADAKLRAGYLLTALGHPRLGRPLVKTLAFGSSVPEIDLDELKVFGVVRLAPRAEDAIADLAEEGSAKRAKADVLEGGLGSDAGELVDKFLAGDNRDFVV